MVVSATAADTGELFHNAKQIEAERQKLFITRRQQQLHHSQQLSHSQQLAEQQVDRIPAPWDRDQEGRENGGHEDGLGGDERDDPKHVAEERAHLAPQETEPENVHRNPEPGPVAEAVVLTVQEVNQEAEATSGQEQRAGRKGENTFMSSRDYSDSSILKIKNVSVQKKMVQYLDFRENFLDITETKNNLCQCISFTHKNVSVQHCSRLALVGFTPCLYS